MKKRNFLIGSLATACSPIWAQDKWGESLGYPTGWGPNGVQQNNKTTTKQWEHKLQSIYKNLSLVFC
jgi:hypothetical protein